MWAGASSKVIVPCALRGQETIIWKSSNEKVAVVTEGEVTAAAPGKAVITAMAGGKSASCEVAVFDAGEKVRAVYLDASSLHIKIGGSQTLTANVLPDSAANNKFAWESKDTSVAEVSADEIVTGVGVGETTVTAVAGDGYHMASCRVIVAQDKDQTYTASFSGGEGTSGRRPSSVSGAAGTIIILPANSYSKTGMLFAGWSDGENTYEEGSLYQMPYRNVTFMQWGFRFF